MILEHDIDLDSEVDTSALGTDLAITLYERMVLVRRFEERVNKLFLQGRIPGTIHLSLGQEACAVGGCSSLRPDDWITITHRGHGQALAKGVSADALMAELFARETGCCKGMGGSLHVGDVSVGALPAIAIVGASIPISAGLAYAAKAQDADRVAVCFSGDGAMTEGDAHEGLNLAALWKLPVVYLVENNLYSVSTRVERQAVVISVAERVAAYGMPAVTIDGNNVQAVHTAVSEAVGRARNGDGPTVVECLTYRQGGHKRDDPATYRPREEVELWLGRDPLRRMREALDRADLAEQADEAEMRAASTIEAAVAFAESSEPASGRCIAS